MSNLLRTLLNAAEQTTRRQFLKGAGGAAGAAALPKMPKATDYTPRQMPEGEFMRTTKMLPAGTKSIFNKSIQGRAPMLDREGNVYLGSVDWADEDYFLSPQEVNELKRQLMQAEKAVQKFEPLERKVLGTRGATYDPSTGGFHQQAHIGFGDEKAGYRVSEAFTPGNVASSPVYHNFVDEAGNVARRPDETWKELIRDVDEAEEFIEDEAFNFTGGANAGKFLQRNYNTQIGQLKKALQADDAGSLQARKKGKHDHLNRLQDKEKQKRLVSGVRFGSNAPVDDAGDPRRAFNQVNPLGELMDVEGSRSIELPIPKRDKPSRFTNPLGLAPFLLQREDDAKTN